MASARAGRPVRGAGPLDTVMAGLACGEPSLLAWQELDRSAAAFLAIPDEAAVYGHAPAGRLRHRVRRVGAAGLAGLLLAAADPRPAPPWPDGSSRVLLFSTEGATDPALYAQLVA